MLLLLAILSIGSVAVLNAQVPTIASFSPTSGPIGTTVTITGTNFSGTSANNIVFFGAVRATVVSATSTSLTVTVPAGATYAPMTVTTNSLTAYSNAPFVVTFPSSRVIDLYSFATGVPLLTGTYPYSVNIGDLDGDGKPDLVVASGDGLSVMRNTSSTGTINSSSFATKIDFTTGGEETFVAIADINGDGKPDILVVNRSGNTFSVFRNTSTLGNISLATRVDFATGTGPQEAAIGDLDGDGKPDVVVTNGNSGFGSTISVYHNNSVGDVVSFSSRVDFTAGGDPYGVAIGDLDGDLKPEIVVANCTSSSVSVFRNTSANGILTTSSFAPKVDFSVSSPYSVALGDLDGDGKSDMALATSRGNVVTVLRNMSVVGSISFASKVDFPVGSDPRGVAMGDLDGDGKPDLVASSWANSIVSVLRNTTGSGGITTGSFAAHVDFGVGLNASEVAVGDLDGDGKSDIAVGNYNARTVSILRNVVGSASSTLPGEYTADANTVLLLHMNETSGSTVSDASSYRNDGRAYSGATILTSGRFGNARSFDGSLNASISVVNTSNLTFGAQDFSAEMWVNTTSSHFAQPFIERWSSSYEFWRVGTAYGFSWFSLNNGSQTVDLRGSAQINDGRWHHQAAVRKGGIAYLYVDGMLQAMRDASFLGVTDSSGGSLLVGEPAFQMTGSVDEVRISNKARSPQEFDLQLPPINLTATPSGTTVNLSWQNGGGAVGLLKYRIYRGSDSTNVVLVDSASVSSYSDVGLSPSTRYFYRVSSLDSLRFEGMKSFAASATTGSSPSAAPTPASPANGSTGIDTRPTLTWSSIGGATSYHLQVSQSSSFSTTVFDDSSITTARRQAGPLQNNRTFYWRVRAKSSSVWSAFSTTFGFSTIQPPAASTVSIRSSFASPGSRPMGLAWDGASLWMVDNLQNVYKLDTSGNVLRTFKIGSFDQDLTWDGTGLWVGGGSRGTGLLRSGELKIDTLGNRVDSLDVFYWSLSGLEWDGKFFWISDYNSSVVYKVARNGTALLNFGVDISSARPTSLSYDGVNLWVGSFNTLTKYSTTGQQLYRFNLSSIGITSTASAFVAWDGQSLWFAQSDQFKIFRLNVPYYYQAPSAPTLVSPSDGATSQPLNPTLVWNRSQDASTYGLQVSTNAAFTALVFNDSTITDTLRQVSGLSGGAYYWRVKAKNSGGSSSYSASRAFTTLSSPISRAIHVSTLGNDANTGTASAPLRNIQTALSRIGNGDTVRVAGGTYMENLTTSTAVVLRGGYKETFSELTRSISGSKTFIKSPGGVMLTDGSSSTIDGFVFDGTGGATKGVLVIAGHSFITHNIVQAITASRGSCIEVGISASATIKNNTVANNMLSTGGTIIYCIYVNGNADGTTVVQNNIAYNNDVGISITTSGVTAGYNCSYANGYNFDGFYGAAGPTDFSKDPKFVFPSNGDFRLKSSSPCINAGNPSDAFGEEPAPNGSRIDMGAYGGTSSATRNGNPTTYVSPSGSDLNDGSANSPLKTIQAGLNGALGDTIKVAAGSYSEGLIIPSQAVLVGGYDSTFSESRRDIFANMTTLLGVSSTIVYDRFGSTIDGFNVNGNAVSGTAFDLASGSRVSHNIIANVSSGSGYGIRVSGNVSVVNNTVRSCPYAVSIQSGSSGSIIKNNIIANNSFGIVNSSANGIARYNDLYSNGFNYSGSYTTPGTGDLSVNPQFRNATAGDYRLAAGSPCIDAGDPTDPVGDEPSPNGNRIDLGAYGGTKNAGAPVTLPVVATSAATSVTGTSATINGTVNPNGTSTNAYFEWGTSSTLSSYNTTASQSIGSGTSSVSVTANLTALNLSTTYYFRVVGQNVAGTQKDSIVKFTTSASSAVLGEYAPDANTVLLLHMNETSGSTLSDASGFSNNGTATVATIVDGKFGKARRFDAQSRIDVPASTSINIGASDFAIEAWVRSSTPDVMNSIYLKRGQGGLQGIELVITSAGLLKFSAYDGVGAATAMYSLRRVDDYGWHHVAVIRQGVLVYLYIDGGFENSINISAAGSLLSGSPLTFGPGWNFIVDFLIDEVRISNKARLPGEFNLQLPPKNLAAITSGTTINLGWQNGGGAVGMLRYKIYRGVDSTNVAVIDSTRSVAYSNSGLQVGTKYYYRISAVDSTGFEGARSYAASAIAPGLVAYYPFSGNANDSSGNGYNGTVSGASLTTDRFGNVGRAYSFNGTNSNIKYGVVPIPINSFTASLWIKPRVIKQTDELLLNAWGNRGFNLYLLQSGGVEFLIAQTSSIVNIVDASLGSNPLNQWHHVVCISDSGKATVYIDGKLGGSKNGPLGTQSNEILVSGYDNGANGYFYDGALDDIRIYNRALSSAEIDALFREGGWPTTTSNPLAMVAVAGGTFTAGSTPVTLSAFNMDKNEITYELWTDVRNWGLTHGYSDLPAGSNGYNPVGSNNPVLGVSWYDAVKWCNARSEKDTLAPVYYTSNTQNTVYRTGQTDINIDAVRWNANGYRLPTEAEWEFAARGGTQTQGYTYSGSNVGGDVAWYFDNSGGTTHAAGQKTANELGIYDMSGNAWEWCWDWYAVAYPSGGSTDPKGPSTTQTHRILRGGSFTDYGNLCLVVYRGHDTPSLRGPTGGFRCAQGGSTQAGQVPPTVTTAAASSVSSSVATLNGSVNPNGSSTTYYFEYGTTTSYGTQTSSASAGSGTIVVNVNAVLTGFTSGTLYHYRLVATNSAGASQGSDMTFTATAIPPTVSTSSASSVTATSAKFSSSVNPNGSTTTAFFEWGTSSTLSSYSTTASQSIGSGTTSVSVNADLSGLSANTTYYYRGAAQNSAGTVRGSIVSFSTVVTAPPAVSPLLPSNGASNQPLTVILSWGSANGATRYRIQLSSSSSFSSILVDDSTLSSTSKQVGPLSYGTTYYWRVSASNAGGSSVYSSTASFTTIPAPAATVSISTTVSFPAKSRAGDFAASDYRIVGLPGSTSIPVASVLSGTQRKDWQVYWDNGNSSNYFVEYDGSNGFAFGSGKAFWVVSKNALTINQSVTSPTLNTSGNFEISLQPGWNLICNPFASSIPWSRIQSANSTAASIFTYNGSFVSSVNLDPYVGYYYFNGSPGTVLSVLKVPYYSLFGNIEGPIGQSFEGWKVTMALSSQAAPEEVPSEAWFGVSLGAKKELDEFDVRKPRSLGFAKELYFDRPEWDPEYPTFVSDVRAQVDEAETWNFKVSTEPFKQTRLVFNGIQNVPASNDVYLVDAANGKSVNLRLDSVYNFISPLRELQFSVLVGVKDAVLKLAAQSLPVDCELSNNFPNPFNPTTSLRLSLPAQSTVNLVIFNVLGQKIRTLSSGELPAGIHWFTWDGKDDRMVSTSSGVYYCLLKIEGRQGIVRRMVLVK